MESDWDIKGVVPCILYDSEGEQAVRFELERWGHGNIARIGVFLRDYNNYTLVIDPYGLADAELCRIAKAVWDANGFGGEEEMMGEWELDLSGLSNWFAIVKSKL